MPAAVLYCRVSTEEQATEGVSLEAQEVKLRAYCELRGLEIADTVVDPGVSAGKPLRSRAGGHRLLESVRKGEAQAVIAWKLDRLFRNAADCLTVVEQWEKRGIALHLVDLGGQAVDTSTAAGKFFLTIMAAVAEMERNQICERTAAAMAHKRAKNEFCGGKPPYGWKVSPDGKTLVEDESEQDTVARARELRSAGLSLRKIGEALTGLGLKPRTGRCWYASNVRSLLCPQEN